MLELWIVFYSEFQGFNHILILTDNEFKTIKHALEEIIQELAGLRILTTC